MPTEPTAGGTAETPGDAAIRGIREAVVRARTPDPVGIEKLRGQHKLTARERIDLLCDPGSFVEDGLL
ncbi:MAG: hypothetical protein AB7V15_10455, partial [Acidimicrobiia bacterium]